MAVPGNHHDNHKRYHVIKNYNIVGRLIQRETGLLNHASSSLSVASRQFYQNILPNLSCINIEKPVCFLRKFTPDGRHLIAFSHDQSSLEVYEYRGPAAASSLLHSQDIRGDCIGQKSEGVRSSIFNTFFRLKHVISVTSNHEQLNRECSLFTDDSRFVILASAALVSDETQLHYFDVYRSNESFLMTTRVPLEDVTVYLVDIIRGRVCDQRSFKTERICLSHNQGISLFKDTLIVLSIQHQVIHVFKVDANPISGDDPCFLDVKNIGRFCFDDDEYIISSIGPANRIPRPFRETCINGLKHRLITYLFKKANHEKEVSGSHSPVKKFFQDFDLLLKLKIWRMQLLDQHHILIKYATEDVVNLRAPDLTSLFVVYNMHSTQILVVFDMMSEELLRLLELHCDLFRNPSASSFVELASSPSNNMYSSLIQKKYKQVLLSAKNTGDFAGTRRLLSQLPIASQSYTCTPYLDHSLFSYDEQWVSSIERPKRGSDLPLQFFHRDSGLLRFTMTTGLGAESSSDRRLVAFIFHPFDPFAITVQRTNSNYVVNLHVRHDQTI